MISKIQRRNKIKTRVTAADISGQRTSRGGTAAGNKVYAIDDLQACSAIPKE